MQWVMVLDEFAFLSFIEDFKYVLAAWKTVKTSRIDEDSVGK